MKRKSISINSVFYNGISQLSDAQIGGLVRALVKWAQDETPQRLEAEANMLFKLMVEGIERKSLVYAANGMRGGAPHGNSNAKTNKTNKSNKFGNASTDTGIAAGGDASISAVRFVKPTLSEVQAYSSERGNIIDASAFVDYYESSGWMVGNKRMKDWKAAFRNWERRRGEANHAGNSEGSKARYGTVIS